VRRTVAYAHGSLRAGAPKSGKARRVDLPATLLRSLQDRKILLEAEAVVTGAVMVPWVFTNRAGRPFDAMNFLHRLWRPLLDKAGLRRIRFHDLRHTYASLMIQRGESLAYVKDQLGHSSIKVTVDLYGHLVPGMNRGAVDRLAAATGSNLYATSEAPPDDERERSAGSAEDEWSRGRELNPRPIDYESIALPLSYPGVGRAES
jgi:integrase